MSSLTIRNLDNDVKERLRQRAAVHGRSMEAEVRHILSEAVLAPPAAELAGRIRERFRACGVDLPDPELHPVRTPPDLGD